MAITVRYFSTSSAGAADGTTWADRAVLFTGGAWSTVITGFAFNASDTLQCLIGPGTHTITATLASGSFANPPSVANTLQMFGCDSSGNLLAIPSAGWVSAQPAWSDSSLPVLATTTNVSVTSLANSIWGLLKFTASGRNGSVLSGVSFLDWCVVSNTTSNSSASGVTAARAYNCVFSCTGTSYDAVGIPTSEFDNCRIVGNYSASSGNRRGVANTGSFRLFRCTVIDNAADAVLSTASSTGFAPFIEQCTIAHNVGTGFKGNPTASQTVWHRAGRCMITGCGAFGIDGQSAAYMSVFQNRLRDNTSGNITGLGNYPTDLNNYTTDSDDATEYVDAASGDYRIKYGAAIWGQGYGAGDQPAPTTIFVRRMGGLAGR